MIELSELYIRDTYNPDGTHKSDQNIAKEVSVEDFISILTNDSDCESVYLIYNLHTKLTKIGKSNNWFNRFNQLRTSSGCELILLAYAELEPSHDVSSEYLEKYLHKYYKNKRATGEWFRLSIRDCLNIIELFYGEANINVDIHNLFNSKQERELLKTKYKSFLT